MAYLPLRPTLAAPPFAAEAAPTKTHVPAPTLAAAPPAPTVAKTNPPLERAGKNGAVRGESRLLFERSELGGALTVPFFPGIRVPSGSPFFGSFFGEAKTELVRRAKPPFKIIIRAADSTTTQPAQAHAANVGHAHIRRWRIPDTKARTDVGRTGKYAIDVNHHCWQSSPVPFTDGIRVRSLAPNTEKPRNRLFCVCHVPSGGPWQGALGLLALFGPASNPAMRLPPRHPTEAGSA